MQWWRHGIVWSPKSDGLFTTGHATAPTPLLMENDCVRVFASCRDKFGCARPFSFDIDLSAKPRVIRASSDPLLDVGAAGTFDNHGVVCTSIVTVDTERLYMYYAGFERLASVRYRIMGGLAISSDGGLTFRRYSEAPVLDRRDDELMFRGGPFVRQSDGGFQMLYAGGSDWTVIDGKEHPVYALRLAHSDDGLNWSSPGRVILRTNDRNFGYGRPWIFKNSQDKTTVLLSIRDRKHKSYGMGVAHFVGDWELTHLEYGMGLEPTGAGPEANQTTFAATITAHGRTWCFYSGNDFGAAGVMLAELVAP